MKRQMRGFTNKEFRRRTETVQQLMDKQGLGVILLTTEPEVRYFSGFLTRFWQSPTRPWFLLIPRKGKPVAVIPKIGEALMKQSWLDDIRTWNSPFPADDGISLLSKTLYELCESAGKVGVPMGPETVLRMPLNDFVHLRESMRQVDFVDATNIVQKVMAIKSLEELSKIASSCDIAGRAFDEIDNVIGDGKSLAAVFRDFQMALLKYGADWVPYLAGAAGPGGYMDIISLPTDRPLHRGDVLMLDTGVIYDGYYSDFDRNFAIYHTDDDARRAYKILYDATEVGISIAAPGATCSDLYNAMYGVIADNGGGDGFVGRLGHGIGTRLTEPPSLMPTDHTMLEPGMVITLEPSLTISAGRMMVHEENIVIQESGCKLLTKRAPPELPIIGV